MKKQRIAALLLALIMILSMAACGQKTEEPADEPEGTSENEGAEYPVELRNTVIRSEPEGVVSLSPALTELMEYMGLGGKLEGVSDFCDRDGLPRCGTPQQPDFKAIQNTGAALVVSTAALTEEDVTTLQQMNIDLLVLPRASTLEELETLYIDLGRAVMGELTGRAMGEELWNDFDERLQDLQTRGEEYVDDRGSAPAVIFLRMLDYTMATGDTFENKLLENMGFKNLAAGYGDWTFPEAGAAELAPDLIISDEAITIPVLEKNSVYKGTQAVIKDQVVTVDMDAFERQSPRMLDELERVADFLFDGDVEARSAQPVGETI